MYFIIYITDIRCCGSYPSELSIYEKRVCKVKIYIIQYADREIRLKFIEHVRFKVVPRNLMRSKLTERDYQNSRAHSCPHSSYPSPYSEKH